ncbi:hypothetical protein BDZ94DRAFT_415553 [Collybia nuda]|uniref:Uncharacterized protein n=1 Tax=Collybia nuda TaxID=64659 RepID=A0A9P5YCL3_9AGAR|nr:hypothetical protein BDZ94DRAFT_415553 [Collybia nuda]
MTARSPYNGPSRKLVIAFDVGTTYSGVSYSILDPGQVPDIKGVTRFPAQERVGGDSKIPSILYYDKDGEVRAVGAEATREEILEMAEDEGWTKAEWFKMHMRPRSIPVSDIMHTMPPLPPRKTVVDVFADYMTYLFNCTKTYIKDTHASGGDLWASLESRIEYVLSHPNGWEGGQQGQMREAAIQARLVPNTHEGRARIHFVTEGEASLHFCIQNGLTTEAMKTGEGVLIVDAGGGTIDLSAYRQAPSAKSYSFEEIAPPQCHLQGSVFVTKRAEAFLRELLGNTKFAGDIHNIRDAFDKNTKPTFRNVVEPQFIKFGSVRDRDPKLNIRGGQLRLLGTDVAGFFEPSIDCIVRAIQEQRAASRHTIPSIFLVGGFAASDYLFTKLKASVEPLGVKTCRPDSHVNKAVADGAVSFYLDHFVAVRVSRFTYGTTCSTTYNPSNLEHVLRSPTIFTSVSGGKRLPGHFSIILPKNTQVSETQEFRESYCVETIDRSSVEEVTSTIECYRGTLDAPHWIDTDVGMFSTLCSVEANTSQISKQLQPIRSATVLEGRRRLQVYYKIQFDIVLSFGLTELKAQIAWMEDGEEKRGPARVVYEPEVVA